LTFLKTFFFLCFAATTFTERGIILRFFCFSVPICWELYELKSS
jgi:hypothetical protein